MRSSALRIVNAILIIGFPIVAGCGPGAPQQEVVGVRRMRVVPVFKVPERTEQRKQLPLLARADKESEFTLVHVRLSHKFAKDNFPLDEWGSSLLAPVGLFRIRSSQGSHEPLFLLSNRCVAPSMTMAIDTLFNGAQPEDFLPSGSRQAIKPAALGPTLAEAGEGTSVKSRGSIQNNNGTMSGSITDIVTGNFRGTLTERPFTPGGDMRINGTLTSQLDDGTPVTIQYAGRQYSIEWSGPWEGYQFAHTYSAVASQENVHDVYCLFRGLPDEGGLMLQVAYAKEIPVVFESP